MTEEQARKYFNSHARYYERGIALDRRNQYGIQLPGGHSVVAPDTDTLWERFWAKVQAVAMIRMIDR